ncbi:hypothetical protein BDV37DRAFT_258918 [Aspergillus pseudonomiae]|uniref:Uncharacterized protein n=1 Tax=Aspergillus pseudonomiae TaxID=1506151 RepID=A0A5N7D163_9EURO|nr:uncharacterized protein BDV37DRAFT_258918 [Aspergillus pseudonomiae]KAE8399969.1 hypothetical protein BDV37DRAFT_258918 [Aspergillus pseudonomiae]
MSLIDCVFLTLVDFGHWFPFLLLPFSTQLLALSTMALIPRFIRFPCRLVALLCFGWQMLSHSSLHFNRSPPRCYDKPREPIRRALTPGSRIISLGCSLSSFLNTQPLLFTICYDLSIDPCLSYNFLYFIPSVVGKTIQKK